MTRFVLKVIYQNQQMTIHELEKLVHIPYQTLYDRIYQHAMSADEAVAKGYRGRRRV